LGRAGLQPYGNHAAAIVRAMNRRLILLAAPLLVLAANAHASDKPKDAQTKDVGQYVDLQPVAMPIVVKGQLINYVFVYVRINLTTSANVTKLREKEPYFRDALVRAAHRTPFVLASDYQKIDEARLVATLTRDATAIVGPGQIRSVVVTSQATQRRIITPKSGGSRPS
jgi:hypothetical protein